MSPVLAEEQHRMGKLQEGLRFPIALLLIVTVDLTLRRPTYRQRPDYDGPESCQTRTSKYKVDNHRVTPDLFVEDESTGPQNPEDLRKELRST
jgi:hypothetical protein